MNMLLCIDDTDNIDSIGTGQVADYIKEEITSTLGIECTMTTRHQLYIHEDIPYTSHNSSMCFEIITEEVAFFETIKRIAVDTIKKYMACGSDPGLCIAYDLSESSVSQLINFGVETKSKIKTKKMAYDLANSCNIFLTELGGTGDGIIGAIAGIGLRLSGNDGELKAGLKDLRPGHYDVNYLLSRSDVQAVVDILSNELVSYGTIQFQSRAKSVLRNHLYTIYVCPENNNYVALKKDVIRRLELNQESDSSFDYLEGCVDYISDVDEEKISDTLNCSNCGYRKWTANSFLCLKGHR